MPEQKHDGDGRKQVIHSYPWYPSDWLTSRDRMRMTPEERGLYRDLLDYLYIHGEVEEDLGSLANMLTCSVECLEHAWSKIRALLTHGVAPNTVTHHRVAETREKLQGYAKDRKEKAKIAAEHRWNPKNGTNHAQNVPGASSEQCVSNATSMLGALPEQCVGNANRCPSTSSTTSTSLNKEDICASGDALPFGDPPRDENPKDKTRPGTAEQQRWHDEVFYPAYFRKRAPDQSMKTFAAKIKTEADLKKLMALVERDRPEMMRRDMEARPYPSTYINQGDWKKIKLAENGSADVPAESGPQTLEEWDGTGVPPKGSWFWM